METVVIAVAIGFAIGVLVGRATAGGGGSPRLSGPLVIKGTVSGDLETRLKALIQSGKNIEAIKLAREETGLGLKQAKDLVDALGRGRSLPDILSGGNGPTF